LSLARQRSYKRILNMDSGRESKTKKRAFPNTRNRQGCAKPREMGKESKNLPHLTRKPWLTPGVPVPMKRVNIKGDQLGTKKSPSMLSEEEPGSIFKWNVSLPKPRNRGKKKVKNPSPGRICLESGRL